MKELDFTDFPPGAITEYTTLVCLACIFDIFTKQIGLAPRSAYSEIKRYSPTVEELTSRKAVRPFFDSDEKHPRCPYCNAAKRWHARLDTYAIEGGKTTDAPRRKLVKSLEKKKDQFAVIEVKSDRRSAFFDWLDTLRVKLDLEEPAWRIAPAIGEVLGALSALPGALLARMSGSGATCFAIFADDDCCGRAADMLKRAQPNWWIAPTFVPQTAVKG